jgi:hypothetical protein
MVAVIMSEPPLLLVVMLAVDGPSRIESGSGAVTAGNGATARAAGASWSGIKALWAASEGITKA